MTLGDIIKEYRKEHSLSMDAFAERSGISKAYISLLEKNKHPKTGKTIAPSVQCIKQAADGMNMDFNVLFSKIDGEVVLDNNIADDNILSIANKLKDCRNNAHLSVKQISAILTQKGFKASESTIYSWENGNSQPTPGAFLAMCKEYGISDVLTTFGYDGYNEDGSIQLNIKEIDIIEKYRALDKHGKEMVDFTLIKEWERSTAEKGNVTEYDYPVLNAAHDRTDVSSTDSDRQHDEDIMDDKNF